VHGALLADGALREINPTLIAHINLSTGIRGQLGSMSIGYTSEQFQRLMAGHGVARSTSRSGNV
jgi:hypothetical protein